MTPDIDIPSARRKRSRNNRNRNQNTNNKRIKSSYYNDDDNFYNDPEDKIVFLISDGDAGDDGEKSDKPGKPGKPDKPDKPDKHDIWKDIDIELKDLEDEIKKIFEMCGIHIIDLPTNDPSNNDPPNQDPKKITTKPLDPVIIPPFNPSNPFFNFCKPPNPPNPPNPPKLPNPPNPPKPPEINCKNPLCNHKTLKADPTPPPAINLQVIKTIDDLIALGKAFHCKKQTTYRGLNLRLMNNLVAPLTELNEMIGLDGVKRHMVNQILFFLQGFNTVGKCNKCQDCVHNLPCIQNNTEMLHTVITGPPGVGKTCLARIIGKVYQAMGILSRGDFHEVARSDFVGKYLGHTAAKTQKLIDECKGGVMFIDEAYSLGHKEKRDSFAKEALDTLNKNLSDRRDFLCIIAGYEKELDECFFATNEGLRRRFTFRYKATEYDHRELADIFKLKVKLENWTIDLNSEEVDGVTKYQENDIVSLFRQHKDKFPYSGGDIETLFLQCKISHGKRIPLKRKCLSYQDIIDGFEQFTKNRKHKAIKSDDGEEKRPNMYILK